MVQMDQENNLNEILQAFCREPIHCRVQPLGCGNINDTYLVESQTVKFVLQKINSTVFPEPLSVIENFYKITEHLREKSKTSGKHLEFAKPVSTEQGDTHYLDRGGNYWRGQTYLDHNDLTQVKERDQAVRVGEILGRFHLFLSDLDVVHLTDPLPGFHNLLLYLSKFDEVSARAEIAPCDEVRYCLETIDRYRVQATTLIDATHSGVLSLQPVHGDPKLDNFVFDAENCPLGLLDLDTVSAGLIHGDLGDCLRSCCNQAGENAADTGQICFDLNIGEAILNGYLNEAGDMITKEQRAYIFDGLLLICFELGLRFFTDHLLGNRYFKVSRDGDNLKKAVTQFRLTDDIALKEESVRAIVSL